MLISFLEFLEGKTTDATSSGDDMDVDSDDQQESKEETPLLPPEAFVHNRADRLKENGGASPSGKVTHNCISVNGGASYTHLC